MRAATSEGVEKKNGGNNFTPAIGTVVNTCHSSTARPATSSCRTSRVRRDITAQCMRPAKCKAITANIPPREAALRGEGFDDRLRAAGLRIALEHLGFQHRPDFAMQIVEGTVGFYLGNFARPGKRDLPVADDPGGWAR